MALPHEVPHRVEHEVRVDRGGAVSEQQRDVVHLACLTGLDDETDPRPGLLADEVVVHRGGDEQARDRRLVLGRVPVREDDEVDPAGDRVADLAADPLDRRAAARRHRRSTGYSASIVTGL